MKLTDIAIIITQKTGTIFPQYQRWKLAGIYWYNSGYERHYLSNIAAEITAPVFNNSFCG